MKGKRVLALVMATMMTVGGDVYKRQVYFLHALHRGVP